MRVDFYQLADGDALGGVLAALSGKLIDEGQRLLVVSEDEAALAALSRSLWRSAPASFIAHDLEGGTDDQRQPVLLSTRDLPANRARNIAIVDGKWRASALGFDRAFFLFAPDQIDAARGAWRDLKDDAASRHYWAQEDGRWTEKG